VDGMSVGKHVSEFFCGVIFYGDFHSAISSLKVGFFFGGKVFVRGLLDFEGFLWAGRFVATIAH
jgi:hypothetical protein